MMKRLFFCFSFTYLFLTGEIYSQNKITPVNPVSNSRLYFFAGTNDPAFCNKDSIIESDCINGRLYLTNKGNAIYIFYCCCGNPEIYTIGKYKINGDSIVCKFSNEFTVGEAGTKANRWELVLKKVNCPEYAYQFTEVLENEGGGTSSQNYVVKAEGKSETAKFVKAISKYRQLNKL